MPNPNPAVGDMVHYYRLEPNSHADAEVLNVRSSSVLRLLVFVRGEDFITDNVPYDESVTTDQSWHWPEPA